MARYSIDGSQAVASPDDTTLGVAAEAGTKARRIAVYDFTVGSEATPADNALVHTAQRFTAEGTGTSVTPMPLDPADAAADATALENHTIEPTYTSNEILWKIAANQRATYRWVAAPDGELIIPATDENGIGWFTTHASFTGVVNVMAHFEER